MKWTMSRDGKQRVTVRAEYRLDAENLADILISRALSLGWDQKDEDPSLAWLEGEIREELSSHGMSQWPYWHDHDDPTDWVLPWARRQVARLGGTIREQETDDE